MSKPFIVVCDGMDKSVFEELKNNENLEVHPSPKLTQEEIKELLPKVNGLVIRSATKPNKEFIDLAPNLKYIIRAGEGTDNIDKTYCQEKGIKVSNTPGANNNSAAEHALALIMTVLRKTASADASMKQGKWEKAQFTGNELWKKTVGIMGFGRIGQILCKRLQGFEPNVLFFDPGIKESEFSYAKKVETLDELFSKSDIISIHTPLLDATKGVVNSDLIGKMKSDAVLVNAARGKIVNEDDLYTALKERTIKGAGFDVFANEPLENESKLKELDNIVLTPHLGGSTEEAQFRVGQMAASQMVEFFVNDNLLNEVKA
ncbi:MAG: 3-phosphoglycerate dehydrogenase [Peredibacter sp.]|nr:3-phosphoglycerate dehydrogenase [Peredibacter sp.]|tara:strand:- start:5095 stop:6045 length:951 start_codon:yes stop_codon:yes gene_type:complete